MQNIWMKRALTCSLAILLLPTFACKKQEDTAQGGIVINEVVTSNGVSLIDDEHGSPDWIELYNAGSTPVDLFGYTITDNITDTQKGYQLPAVTIPAHGYVVLYANPTSTDLLEWEGDAICIGFSLKAAGENLALMDDRMQLIQELTVPALERDISYARRSDGTYAFCATPTPQEENTTPFYESVELAAKQLDGASANPTRGIVFNEVSSKNATEVICSSCAYCDWIELRNLTDSDIDLTGFTLTDDPTDAPKGNLQVVLPANGYSLILCCKEDCQDASHTCVPMGVSGRGETIVLLDTYGNIVAELNMPSILEQDETYARREDGTYGYCFSPTPGEQNGPISDVQETVETNGVRGLLLSEVLASNAYSVKDFEGERVDWVELYNPTSEAVSLAGCYLSDDTDSLNKWAFPDVSIEPNGYLLVFLSGKTTQETTELHASFSLSDGESLVLYCERSRTYDAVSIPSLRANISVGKTANGEVVYYSHPTPMMPNGHAETEADAIGFFRTDSVFISEVCAIHERGSDLNDWIEIHNGGEQRVKLDGWYLSDDADDLTKWKIDSLAIAGGDYVVIETTGGKARGSENTATFGISPSGETLYLSDDSGMVQDVFSTGVQKLGMSSGRLETDSETARVYFQNPTRGKANNSALYRGYTSDPVFSETALYQTDAFYLELSCANADAVIYYTTDGSDPTTNAKRYESPIEIKKNAVIRAVAVSDGRMDSEIIGYHYLFEKQHTVPVVCIAMDPGDFKTVYSVKEHKDIKERKASIQYYEKDGKIAVSFPCDIKAKGQGTLVYPQKSFSIHLRGSYGQSSVDYPFFEDYPYTDFAALVLRNGGQDYNDTRFIDSFVSRACIGLNLEVANSRPVVVYINGAYYGLYDFNEDLNADYLETHYGADPDMVDLVRRNGGIATQGSKTEFKRVFRYAEKADLSSQKKYDEFCEWVDVDYFIDYIIVQTYIANSDMFNQKYWRTQDYSIKWRPVLYDLDFAFGSSTRNIMSKYFEYEGTPSNNGSLTYFYISCALRTNADFCERFVERYVEVVCTYFNEERMLALLDTMYKEYEPEMERNLKRWGMIRSVSKWEDNLDTLRVILQRRPANILEQLQKEFRVSDEKMNELIAKYS